MADFFYYTLEDGTFTTGGGGTPADATELSAPTVTYPTLGSIALDGYFPDIDRPHLWFKFTPTDAGNVALDTELSFLDGTFDHDVDDKPYVSLTVWVRNAGVTTPSTVDDLHASPAFAVSFGDRTSGMLHASPGETYWIRVGNNGPDDGTAMFILQVSDYGTTTDWGSLSDQQWVIVPAGDELADNDLPDPAFLSATPQPNHLPDYVPNFPGGHFGLGFNQKWDHGYNGHYTLTQTFNGPEPGQDGSSHPCMWFWARRGNWGGQFWGLYPDGDGAPTHSPSSWNGTDPYDSGVPGGGTCLTHTGTPDSTASVQFGGVSIRFASDVSGGFSAKNAHFESHSACSRLNLTKVRTDATPSAGAVVPDPPTGFETASLIWEDATCEITDLDIAPDELLLPDRSGPQVPSVDGMGGATFYARWYVAAVPADENPLEVWGPDRVNEKWWGTSGGAPEGILALTSEVTVDYNGGLVDWQPLSSTTIDNALTYEAAGADFGLRGIAVSPDQLSDTVPPLSILGTGGEDLTISRGAQVLSYRVHLSPSRYKWSLDPEMPPVVIAAGQLRVHPRDDAVNAGTAYRTFPPQKATRVHGGYP